MQRQKQERKKVFKAKVATRELVTRGLEGQVHGVGKWARIQLRENSSADGK